MDLLVAGPNGYRCVTPADGWAESPAFGCEFRLQRESDSEGFVALFLDVRERT